MEPPPRKFNGSAQPFLVNIALGGYIVLELAVIAYIIKLITT